MSHGHQIVLLAGAGVLILGALFFAIGYLRGRMIRDWTETTGMIVNKDGSTGGLAAQYPTFTWRDAAGVEHQRTSMMGASLGRRPGTLVTVRYDPEDPSRAVIDSFAQSGRVFVVIGLVIALIAVLAVAWGWLLVGTFN